MEPETNDETLTQEVKEKSVLHTVTPLSKYLAMALFIIIPFVGGWIGYHYAPEKVIEVERVVEMNNNEFVAEIGTDTENISIEQDNTLVPREKVAHKQVCELTAADKVFNQRDFNLNQGPDPGTVEWLNRYYARDDQYVYAGSNVLADVNPETFYITGDCINDIFGVGEEKVFLFAEHLTELDGYSFEYINSMFVKDKDSVYMVGTSRNLIKLDLVDPDTFETIHSFSPDFSPWSGLFFKDITAVYARIGHDDYAMVPGADPETFEVLSNLGYSKDKDNVYWYNRWLVEGADSNSFQLLDRELAKDNNTVYLAGSVVEDADSETFIKLGGCYYRDAFQVYCSLQEGASPRYISPIKSADLDTFVVEEIEKKNSNGHAYTTYQASDKNGVYEFFTLIPPEQ